MFETKITGIFAVQPNNGPTIVRVDTDAGVSGFGSCHASGPAARDAIATLHNGRLPHLGLIGKDPLAIEVHHHNMLYAFPQDMRQAKILSGIDIALWDLAGKLLGEPVHRLLGGAFHTQIALYSHATGGDYLSADAWRERARDLREDPLGFKAYKIDFHHVLGGRMQEVIYSLGPREISALEKAYTLAREALGDAIDIIVHCHCELDLPSAIRFAKVIERIKPLWFEDPLAPAFSEAWLALRRETSVPILTGENLVLPEAFEPFLRHGAVDCMQPDLINCGGITAARRIAALAAVHRMPLACHNVSGTILNMASLHFSAAVFNCPWLECVRKPLNAPGIVGNPIEIHDGRMRVPNTPGLGFEIDEDYLKAHRAPGEPWWG